jgi:uncharacterized membrane protein
MRNLGKKYFGFILLLLFFLFPAVVYAQQDTSEGEIFKGKVLEQRDVDCGGMVEGIELSCIAYDIELSDGDVVETMPTWINNEEDLFKVGSRVYVSLSEGIDGEEVWSVESYSRENSLLFLFSLFVLLIIIITGVRGVRATLGLAVSFLVLYFFAIPRINMGQSLFWVAVITIFILLGASTFVTYGINIKSVIAFISTLLGIILISLLGYIVISNLNITGTGDESSAMLYDATFGTIRLSSIFLLSIVIGSLGVLDDVTVGQTSAMMEIYSANKSLSSTELFKRSMNIGKDHISSMVNTLFIAYAGSSFSLVMLLSANNPNFRILINTGFVVEEIVRTLVASIGLILVVPLTSLLASRIIVKVLK